MSGRARKMFGGGRGWHLSGFISRVCPKEGSVDHEQLPLGYPKNYESHTLTQNGFRNQLGIINKVVYYIQEFMALSEEHN